MMKFKIKKITQTVYVTTDGCEFSGKGSKIEARDHQRQIELENNKDIWCKKLWILFGFPPDVAPHDLYTPDPSTPLEKEVHELLAHISDIMGFNSDIESFADLSEMLFGLFTEYHDQMTKIDQLVSEVLTEANLSTP